MNKYLRMGVLVLVDIFLINLALFLSLAIRFDGLGNVPFQYLQNAISLAPIVTVIRIACLYAFGLYKRLWKYASIGELLSIFYAITAGSILTLVVSYFFAGGALPLPRSVFLLAWMLNIILIGSSRLVWRLLTDENTRTYLGHKGKNILIVGAGDSGVIIAKELKRHYKDVKIVGFIDDDINKEHHRILGLPVLGNRYKIPEIVKEFFVEEIILALPSAKGSAVRDIIDICYSTKAEVKTLPGIYDLVEGNITVNTIREVQVEDLLGREPVKVNLDEICNYLTDQVLLITGAGGSIGSELCRQIIQFNPKKVLLLDNSENSIYEIERELKKLNPHIELVSLVKDIRDKQAIHDVFELYKPHVVFHAAAHKHVPLMEVNPEEAVKNNIMGTYNIARTADFFGVKRFVLISTDKAVNPTSIMGATKRVSEMIIQHLDKVSETTYTAVRFGNVLGSNGSVVPLFKQQIAEGGPVTVTHEKMIRYFMTIPEAVQLVLQAGVMAKGGEVFVLDMGEPVKIMDLAKSLIKLSGLEIGKDIDIVVTGIRPGEKLFEELLSAEEGVNSTTHKRIFVAKPNNINASLIEKTMVDMYAGKYPKDRNQTIGFLRRFLPNFKEEDKKEMVG